jgi:hypothetical protein
MTTAKYEFVPCEGSGRTPYSENGMDLCPRCGNDVETYIGELVDHERLDLAAMIENGFFS